jgi:hypothetical protein
MLGSFLPPAPTPSLTTHSTSPLSLPPPSIPGRKVAMNYLSFCLFQRVFISPLFLKDGLAGYSTLYQQIFSLRIWNMSFNSLLVYKVSTEKSAVNLLGIPLHVT